MILSTHSITCALAHVTHTENLFVHNVRASKPNVFHSEITIDGTHPYLYENPKIANHVSGTTFIEAGRQLLKAITHLYYDIPIENRFVLHGINIEFIRWVKLNVPIAITVILNLNIVKNSKARCLFETELVYHQEGHLVTKLNSSFTTFTQMLEDKLMRRQYAQPLLKKNDI